MNVTANNFTHYQFAFKEIDKKQREGVHTFERPACFNVNQPFDLKTPNVLFFTSPIEEGRSRLLMQEFKAKFVPKWLLHFAMNQVVNGDAWLNDAERSARITSADNNKPRSVAVGAARDGRKATYGLNFMVASQSDMSPTTFRKWWSTYGFADAPPNTFGPASASSMSKHALSRAEQIDPWIYHAKNCIICRRALGQMRVLDSRGCNWCDLFSKEAAVRHCICSYWDLCAHLFAKAGNHDRRKPE
jgi:hypothetical protein